MRKIPLAIVVLAALTGSALAADLPSTKSAPSYIAPVSAYDWTGFYLGVDVGGVWGQGKYTSWNVSTSVNPASVLGGGFAGYNYQINQFVLGLQGEIDGMGVKGTNGALTLKEDYLGSIDGRLGFAVDRALFYAIGGVAFTNTKFTVNGTGYNGNSTGNDVGGGIEYAFLPNWTVRAEYRYYDFGRTNTPAIVNRNDGPNILAGRLTKSDNVVRAGLAYKFGAPEPVVAKY